MSKLVIAAALAVSAASAAACAGRAVVLDEGAGAFAGPETILRRSDAMARGRARLRSGDAALKPAYDALLAAADEAMRVAPLSVMQKKRVPPSGDPHDYMSLAPYWWPDSTKPGGVPFIRRDGDVNPESRLDTDSPRFARLTETVDVLTLAYYFSGDAKYASRAAVFLRTWFLDPATRMNPNLRFAQAIPGVTEGRGIGLIDTRNLATIADDVILLRGAPGWSAADAAAMRDWAGVFLRWMQTSPQGKEEAIQKNNHGTWYDSQLAALALFVGDTALARRTILAAGPERVATQIAPDGKQPEELARTRPVHYSLFNLEAFVRLAEMGRDVGVDLWHYRAPNGGSIGQAIRFIGPYLDPKTKWGTGDITPVHPEEFIGMLRQADAALHDSAIAAELRSLPADALRRDRSRLLHPDDAAASRVGSADLDKLAAHALAVASTNMRRAASQLDPAAGFPRTSRPDGTWNVLPVSQWTSGFFPGCLWLMYEATADAYWRDQARRWTAAVESAKTRTNTHDLGFLIFTSFGQGFRLTGDSAYRDVILTAARSLATRFNPAVGAIKSWDTEGAGGPRGSWRYPVIIDNMMNLELLFWAGAHGGDPRWRTIAERHALTSARAHVRADGSTAHVALFDPETGALLGRVTWQGLADSSVWARGQAWAVYGFSRAYEETRNPELLATARRAADWYLSHLPADAVPYWDFRDPAIPNVERDASAAAIAASGLLALARDVDAETAVRYRAGAERTLVTLASSYLEEGPTAMALLKHSVGQKPQHAEVDVGLIYSDYYFLEALARYRALAR